MIVAPFLRYPYPQSPPFKATLRKVNSQTRWRYHIVLDSEGTQGSLHAEYDAEIKAAFEKPAKGDKGTVVSNARMAVSLTNLAERRSDAPDSKSAKFGLATWEMPDTRIPKELAINGQIGTYFVPFFCLFLPKSPDPEGKFADQIKLSEPFTIDGTGVAKYAGKDYFVDAKWSVSGATIQTNAAFNADGKLLKGTCTVKMSDANSKYTIQSR